MCSWDTVLKLYLLNSILADPVNSARNPTKKHKRKLQRKCIVIQTHTYLTETKNLLLKVL